MVLEGAQSAAKLPDLLGDGARAAAIGRALAGVAPLHLAETEVHEQKVAHTHT